MLGYEVYEKEEVEEEQKLSRYVSEDMKFPNFIIRDTNNSLEMVKLKVFKEMTSMLEATLNAEEEDLSIAIYYTNDEKTAYLGKIQPIQVKTFLELFNNVEVFGYYDKNTELRDDMRYSLAN